MTLHKYWIKFELSINDPHPIGTLMGCGVTAFSREDALTLLQQRVFQSQLLPPIKRFIEDVDTASLDPNHVTPNIGDPTKRGLWFPRGYDESAQVTEVA